jgi:hypothetical protein
VLQPDRDLLARDGAMNAMSGQYLDSGGGEKGGLGIGSNKNLTIPRCKWPQIARPFVSMRCRTRAYLEILDLNIQLRSLNVASAGICELVGLSVATMRFLLQDFPAAPDSFVLFDIGRIWRPRCDLVARLKATGSRRLGQRHVEGSGPFQGVFGTNNNQKQS